MCCWHNQDQIMHNFAVKLGECMLWTCVFNDQSIFTISLRDIWVFDEMAKLLALEVAFLTCLKCKVHIMHSFSKKWIATDEFASTSFNVVDPKIRNALVNLPRNKLTSIVKMKSNGKSLDRFPQITTSPFHWTSHLSC